MSVFGVRVHVCVRGPILRKSTNSTLGKRASFSQNSQKWRALSENVRLFCSILRNSYVSLKLSDFLEM